MAFRIRRGRPPGQMGNGEDKGTPELRQKMRLGLTQEPLDRALARGFIGAEEHWCGLHLRWLHTLRYGAAQLSSYQRELLGMKGVREDSPEWRAEREEEYLEAAALLSRERLLPPLLAVCVYDETPLFLEPIKPNGDLKKFEARQEAAAHELAALRQGLQLLAKKWRRGGAL